MWDQLQMDGTDVYHLEATPAACVVFAAKSGILPPFDLCLSGVNAGENLGSGLTISGTFGAALEAADMGMRSIALSRHTVEPFAAIQMNGTGMCLPSTSRRR